MLAGLKDPPRIIPNTALSAAGEFHTHGFAMLTLGSNSATADYYEDLNGTAHKLYTETLG